MVRGKEKGSEFERAMAKRLSLWLTEGKSAKELVRADTQRIAAKPGEVTPDGWANVGDLAPAGPSGREFRRVAAVECKHHRQIDWWWFFTSKTPILLDWWKKLKADCAPHNLIPLLIMRQNGRPAMIGTDWPFEPTGCDELLLQTADHVMIRFLRLDDFLSTPWRVYHDAWRDGHAR